MKLVVLESPYAGNVTFNKFYARHCLMHSLLRGEAPFMGHLLYTQVLNDNVSYEREKGICCHIAWINACDAVILYLDYGKSAGMIEAEKYALSVGKKIEYRRVKNP